MHLRSRFALALLAGLTAPITFAQVQVTRTGQAVAPPPPPTPIRVELDDLDGDVIRRGNDWLLEIEYEVKVRTPQHLVPLVLYVDVSEGGRAIRDHQGRPLQIAIPLDRPTKQKRSKIEYEGTALVVLDPRSFGKADFDLRGSVVQAGSTHVLAREEGDADYDRPWRWRPTFGVGVGIGPVGVGIGI